MVGSRSEGGFLGWELARVYVSSTVVDLTEERRAVLDWLRLARHQAVDSYLPDSDTVRDSCLDDVAKCDLYVLIVGHRHGFRPAEDNPEGLSITQLEFRRAGECGIPRVALLRTSIPDVRLSDLQDPARAPLVLAFRDEVADQVRPAEFSDLKGLIQGLSTGIQAALDKLDKREKRPDGPVAVGRVLRLAPRPVFLAGREELLAGLEARLAGGDGVGPRVVALCGLGGAGKTSVALEYAHRHLAGVGVVWQFGAEDQSVLAAGFGDLAAQLGAADGGDPVTWVHGVLAASSAPWLLVFDNAPDRASVVRFMPPTGPGRVLVTSRNQIWPPGQAVEVPVLDRQVAAGFLAARTGDADWRAALELAVELGGLPLALEQAGAYMQASGRGIAGYLGLFRARRAELLDKGDPAGYDKRVSTTWALAFAELGQASPAAGLLRLVACCAAEDIPLDLLLRRGLVAEDFDAVVGPVLVPLLGDDLARDEAVAGLRRFSLISAPQRELISVHRLVQAITLAQLPPREAAAWRRAAATVIEAALPGDPEDPECWPVFAALLPHAQAALHPASDGMYQLARYLGASGSYVAALAVQRHVLRAREEAWGAEHPDMLTARDYLATWTGEAGDEAGARDQFAALVPVFERVLGAEHPATLTARANLARWTGEAGDAVAARDQFAALVPVRERVSGAEHSETLTARGNLAYWTGEAGDAEEARNQLAALVPIREQVLGAEHSETLTDRANLVRWTGEAGDAAGARDQLAALVPIRERVLGAEHPRTLTARANLARWTGEAGDPDAARNLLAALLPVRERVSGPDHPDTLTTRASLARYTGQAGDSAAARDLIAGLLPVHERVSGPEHPDTLHAQYELACWTGLAGDPDAARDLLAALLPVRERVLGPEHPDTLITRGNLADWTGIAGDPAAARDLLAALLPVLERVSGPEHPDTLHAQYELARWTGLAGDPAAARDLLAALLPVRERVLGPEHPDTLRTRGNLAIWTGHAGDPAAARDLLAAVLPEGERVLPEHPDVLHARHELADWTGHAGDPAAARDLLAALLPVRERVLGPEHPDTLRTRGNLADWTERAECGPSRA